MQINTAAVQQRKVNLFRIAAILLVLVCLLGVLSKTVFAQTTYIITDGENTTVHTTYTSDFEEVLAEAGLTLEEGDLYATQETDDGNTEIIIQRAQNITVFNCGEETFAQSYGETVEELLTRLGIPAYGDYQVSEPLLSETFDGMTLYVDYIVDEEQTYTVEIPFEVSYADDPLLAAGEEVVIVTGKPGQTTRTDSVWFKNGEEMDRIQLEETVLKNPTNQYVLRGTGEKVGAKRTQPLIGDGFIVTPEGKVLTYSHSDVFQATAYSHFDEGCNEITATGTTVRIGTVAVDPRLIPYFTEMYIVSNDGKYIYGLSRAEDCGGAIQGKRIDLYYPTLAQCFQFGRRNCTVYFLTDNG